jgi:hypothetical protein
MSEASSAVRGTSATETSDALSAADGFDLSIDGWYVVAAALSPRAPARGERLKTVVALSRTMAADVQRTAASSLAVTRAPHGGGGLPRRH